MRLCTKYDCKQ